MQKTFITLLLLLVSVTGLAQLEANLLVSAHQATATEMTAITNPIPGSLLFNTDTQTLHVYSNNQWEDLGIQGSETKIVVGENITITGTGTSNDPYTLSAKKAAFTQNTDGSYTFSNGIDEDITFTGMPLNYPIVSNNTGNLGSCSQFATNETKNIIITGNYFDGSATVSIPGQTVNNVTVDSETQLTVNVTSGNTGGYFDIQVITSTGMGNLPNGFSVETPKTTYNLGVNDIFRTGTVGYSNGILDKTSGSGWSSQGYSISNLIPNGEEGSLSFTAETNNRLRMVGLNSDPTTDASYTSLDYAIYLHSNTYVYVYESGANKGRFTTYSVGDVFEIEVDCTGRVSYLINGSEFYNSATSASGDLYLDSSFHQTNSGISNINMTY